MKPSDDSKTPPPLDLPGEALADLRKCYFLIAPGLSIVLAVLGARQYAGSWNDGSRLAAVESLLERGTLAIDGSMFVNPSLAPPGHSPYSPKDEALQARGTLDKLLIRGQFHSDKPPVTSIALASLYRVCQWLGLGPDPGKDPEGFIRVLTLASSTGAYLVALACMHILGRHLGLARGVHSVWLGSFALGTFALAYTRHVNGHIMHLGVAAIWCLGAVRLARGGLSIGARAAWAAGIGSALGFGYNLDLGSGPLMLAAGLLLLAIRSGPAAFIAACLTASPWVVACHWLNLEIGAVAGPLNAVPAYLAWPGSPFGTGNMTGIMRHSPAGFLLYAASLLAGKHGVLTHNLPLLLGIPAVAILWRRTPYKLELAATLGWCGAAWILYSLMSNNHSGGSCSVRWFVPFLAPGFFLLAAHLAQRPEQALDLAVLGAWGAALGLTMWWIGPWTTRMIPGLWPIVGCALASWMAVALWRARARLVPPG